MYRGYYWTAFMIIHINRKVTLNREIVSIGNDFIENLRKIQSNKNNNIDCQVSNKSKINTMKEIFD